MKRVLFVLTMLAVASLLAPTTASAVAMYENGDTCPATLDSFTRQYQIPGALACVFDPDVSNIQGTQAEADLYLNGGPDPPWGDGWVGLGQNSFGFTADAGNDDGTFTITPGIYGQFAVGVKDGGSPSWAIFLLDEGVFSGDWHFLTQEGDLSHFTLYGRVVETGPGGGPGGQDPAGGEVPEPASLLLLGTGLAFAGARARRRWTGSK